MPSLPTALARPVFASLTAQLPPPADDTAEARALRDQTAMDKVAALHPTDAMEASIAVDIVLAEAHARDCFRAAGVYFNDLAAMLRCRAQANALLRQMRSLLRDYHHTQAERDKALVAMHPGAMERAGYWYCDASLPAPEPPPPAPPPPPTAETAAASPPKPIFETMSEVEQYAMLHPRRAALIRAAGGLPARLDFGPPEPALVDAIVRSTSPILLALDGGQAAAESR